MKEKQLICMIERSLKPVVLTGIAVTLICVTSCKHTESTPQGDKVEEVENYIEFETISDKNLWLKMDSSSLKSEQSNRLVDAYNASVVMNSIMTDFDLQMRGYELDDVVKAINSIDITKIKDSEVLAKLKAYKEEMLYLLSVDPEKVDQNIHSPWKANGDLYAYLSKKYHVSTFGLLDEDKYWDKYNNCPNVPEWKQLREKRGDANLVKGLKTKYESAKDFDARCIYAIELAHAYEGDLDLWHDEFRNPAIPIMESLMKEKKYSLYLNELWQKWRVLYQNSKGASKDSEIPNRLYNDYRNKCVCTILSYIEENPQDIMAINEFLVMACKENILREGEFDYGNQAAVEKYYLFPERYNKENEE